MAVVQKFQNKICLDPSSFISIITSKVAWLGWKQFKINEQLQMKTVTNYFSSLEISK